MPARISFNMRVSDEDDARFDRLADRIAAQTGNRPNRSELIRWLAEAAERDNWLADGTWLSGFLDGFTRRRRRRTAA